jgi:toxin ParE1/3/4
MSTQIRTTPAARADLAALAAYLIEQSPEVAERFLDAVEACFELLATNPELGGSYAMPNARLVNLRARTIRNFEKYVVFYQAHGQTVEIIRVLHGSQDIAAIVEDL